MIADVKSKSAKQKFLEAVRSLTQKQPTNSANVKDLLTLQLRYKLEETVDNFSHVLPRENWIDDQVIKYHIRERIQRLESNKANHRHIEDEKRIREADEALEQKKLNLLKHYYRASYPGRTVTYDRPPSSFEIREEKVKAEILEWLPQEYSSYLSEEVLKQLESEIVGENYLDDEESQSTEFDPEEQANVLLSLFLLAKEAESSLLDKYHMDKDTDIYRLVAIATNQDFTTIQTRGKSLKRVIQKNEDSTAPKRFTPIAEVERRLKADDKGLGIDNKVGESICKVINEIKKRYKI